MGIIARLAINPHSTAAFETAFLEYQATVRREEPGNLYFQVYRDPALPGSYVVMEGYADAAALEAHRNTAHYQAIPAVFGALMAGPPEIEVFEGLE
jgi:quinol monooxygenase YgiN